MRISKAKNIFEKGYKHNWMPEIFIVDKVFRSNNIYSYRIIDQNNLAIKGRFYDKEMQRVGLPDIIYVEKILKRRKVKRDRYPMAYVKWLYKPESLNSWISLSKAKKLQRHV